MHWLVGIIAAGAVFQAFDAIDFWFQAQVQSKYTVVPRNLVFFAIAFVKIALIQIKAPLIAFAWVGLAEVALSTIGLVIAYQVSGQKLTRWRMSLHRAQNLLKDSWSLAISSVAILIYMKIDQLMLGEMMGDQEVGFYSVGIKISELWYFIPTAIVSSVAPSIIEAKKIDQALYYQRIQKLLNLVTGLAFTIAIPITAFSGSIILILFGKSFAASAPVLTAHIWSMPFVFSGIAASVWITAEGVFSRTLLTTAIGGFSNILLNLLLIPKYAALGAAIATLLSYAIASYLANFFIFKGYPIFRMQSNALISSLMFGTWKKISQFFS
jgi:PST family polysaccharide transporter